MSKVSEHMGKIITCILPKGKARPLLEALNQKGITRINFAYARGFDIHDPESKKGLPEYVEKEIVTVVVKNEAEGEEVFDFIFNESGLNRLGGGMMYMSRLSGATAYLLPDLEPVSVQGETAKAAREKPAGSEISA